MQSYAVAPNGQQQNNKVSNLSYEEQSDMVDSGDEIEPHHIKGTRQLNVRAGNGRDNQVVGVLNEYDTFEVKGCEVAPYGVDIWCNITFYRPDGTYVGWVNSDFIEGINTIGVPFKVVNTPANGTVSIRKGNSIYTQSIGEIPSYTRDMRFKICAPNGQNQVWCKLDNPSVKGWIRKKYLDYDF